MLETSSKTNLEYLEKYKTDKNPNNFHSTHDKYMF